MWFVKTLISVCLAAASNALAATYHVAPSGDDGYTCAQARSADTPKRTIAAGIACLAPGDTLVVRAGTYPGQQITNPPGGSAEAYTVIRSFPGERPRITRVGPYDRGLYLTQGSASSYIEVRGFEFDGVYDGVKTVGTDQIGYPHHLRFVDNRVHHTISTGMLISAKPDGTAGGDHYVAHNEFYQIGYGTPGYHGMNTIYHPGNRSVVEYNVFHNDVNGVGIYSGGDLIYDVVVRNNIFYDMFRPDLDPWQVGASGGSAVHVTSPGGRHLIYNNIIYRSGAEGTFFGIGAYYGPDDVKICNNTIHDLLHPDALAVYVDGSTATDVMVMNNIAFQTGGIYGGVQASNTTQDPLFCDPIAADFRIQDGSPALDQGTTLGEVTTDIVGTPRPQGDGFDIGAYEMWPDDDCSPVSVGPSTLPDDGGSGARDGVALTIVNPHRFGGQISYSIPGRARVRLEVFDAAGRRLETLVDDWQERGTHRLTWPGDRSAGLRAGIYFVRLSAGQGTGATRKILVLK